MLNNLNGRFLFSCPFVKIQVWRRSWVKCVTELTLLGLLLDYVVLLTLQEVVKWRSPKLFSSKWLIFNWNFSHVVFLYLWLISKVHSKCLILRILSLTLFFLSLKVTWKVKFRFPINFYFTLGFTIFIFWIWKLILIFPTELDYFIFPILFLSLFKIQTGAKFGKTHLFNFGILLSNILVLWYLTSTLLSLLFNLLADHFFGLNQLFPCDLANESLKRD